MKTRSFKQWVDRIQNQIRFCVLHVWNVALLNADYCEMASRGMNLSQNADVFRQFFMLTYSVFAIGSFIFFLVKKILHVIKTELSVDKNYKKQA